MINFNNKKMSQKRKRHQQTKKKTRKRYGYQKIRRKKLME